jgi:hypothetical protein
VLCYAVLCCAVLCCAEVGALRWVRCGECVSAYIWHIWTYLGVSAYIWHI